MNLLPLILLLGADPASSLVEQGDVRIQVSIRSSIYTYDITNLGRDPINAVEIDFTHGYNFIAPDGWENEETETGFRAWCQEDRDALGWHDTGQFSIRMSSGGGVLGQVQVRLEPETGEPVTVQNVWGTIAEPRGHVMLVAGVVAILFAGHFLLTVRRSARSAPLPD